MVDATDPVTGASVRTARFGDSLDITIAASNAGTFIAKNYQVMVAISSDNALSLLNDTVVIEQAGPDLAPGASQNLTFHVVLPMKDRSNKDFTTGNWFIFVQLNSTGSVGEANMVNNALSVGPMKLYAPGPDLIVSTVQAPASAGVGEIVPVYRSLRNVGNVDAITNYRYYISANNIITTDDLPLLIVAPDGSTSPSGTVTLAKGNANSASELVRLPAQMQPGTWYIGCYVDPDNTVAELIETNNGTASSSVLVAGSTLKVVTSQVPDAIVGRSYLFRLAASGEIGPSTWALDASQGQLPDGLAMAADGTISGTPSGKEGVLVTAFTAVVTNSGQSTAGRVAMRVLPASSQVEISTAALPAAINTPTVPYQVGLGASGGVRPYSWRVAVGALPAGLALSGDGVISGAPRAGQPDGVSAVTLEVRDATGSTARKALQVRLVSAGALIFKSIAMPDGAIGAEYATEVAVENVDGSALAKPLTFRATGHLPPGITAQSQAEVVLVAGTPTVGGDFGFTLSVEDARGRTDTIELSIHVVAPRLKLSATLPPLLRPGEAVNVAFKADPSNGARFELVSGALPPGVELHADGAVVGRVATEQSEGTWAFVVQAADPAGSSGLGAFALVVERAPVKTGCSATGEGTGPLALLAVGLLALRRRRLEAWFQAARGGAVAAAVALALVPGLASAQTGYTLDGPTPTTFQPLAAGTSLSPSTLSGATVQLPFAFDFYGTPINTVVMTRYGYLALLGSDDSTSSNMSIPHSNTSTYYPQSLIAPWWDSLGGGSFKWQALGTAPSRIAVFEWTNVYASTSSSQKVTFQAQLFEGSGQIRFAYGPTSPGASSASIGVMRDVGVGLGFGTCGAAGNCSTADFPANQAIDFVRPPDFTMKAVVPDTTGYSGVVHRTQVTVGNLGGKASPATVRLFLSVDTHYDSSDATLGEVTLANVPAQGEASGVVTGLVPSAIVPGPYFVLAQVDPDNLVLEQNESNNWFVPQQITIASPAADLAVTAVSAPGTIAPGAMMTVSRTLQNVGNSAVGTFKYSWFLSNNPAVTIADTALTPVGTVAGGLAPRATDVGTDTLALPANLKAGQYWLGVCVNYDSSSSTVGFLEPEITWLNNCVGSRTATVVSSGSLAVLTTTLPGAAQYAPWGMRLAATGGDGAYTWALSSGALPPGMNFSPQGDLAGAPATTGAFSFTVKVTSAGQSQEQALSLQVAAGNLPLVVVDQDLPAAEFGRAYSAALVALGGKPPYTWQVRDGALPVGLALATDGHVEGRASTGTAGTFTVEVTDAANTSVSKELTLRVVNPASLAIANQSLAEGQILHDYLQPLAAVGGTKPYTWSVTSFQQVAENATEAPGAVATELPAALGLVLENAASGSFLRGVPKVAGLYKVGLKVTDSAAVEDNATLFLYVTYRDGLAITTLSLPDAFVGMNYVARLSHNADPNQVEVKFATTCLLEQKRAGEYGCVDVAATEQLPAGLTLDEKGFLGGGATGPEGVYSFLVKATDGAGRQDVRAMAIRVRAAPATAGCTTGGVAPSFLAALALLGGVLRARRAGRRS